MRARVTVLLLLLVPLLLSAGPSTAAAQDGRVPVVATFSILGDVVANVGGDRINLRTLIGPDGDAHTYDPTPADARALASAAVVFEVGVNFEPWLPDLYRAARARAQRVVVSDGQQLLRSPEAGHRHGEFDPHLWTAVPNVIAFTYRVRDGLIAADPAGADTYTANANAYAAQLAELDAWVRGEVARLPADRRRLVTAHATFAYFADRYGFEVVGAAIPSTSTDAEPSAREIAALVSAIRDAGVPAIFPENVSNPRLMRRIADEAGVALAPPLYTDALGRAGTPGDTYIGMMRANVATIVAALGR